MTTVTIGVESPESVKTRMKAAACGEPQGAHITFSTLELMWDVLNQKRWEIVRAMTDVGPLSIREVARRVGRGVKSVHGDVQILLNAGVLERTESGQIIFPYQSVHVKYTVDPATA